MLKTFKVVTVGEPKTANSGKEYVEVSTKKHLCIAFWSHTAISFISNLKTPFQVTCDCAKPREDYSQFLQHSYWVRENKNIVAKDSDGKVIGKI